MPGRGWVSTVGRVKRDREKWDTKEEGGTALLKHPAAACAIMPCRTTSVRELRKAICSILSSSLLCISRRWTVRLRLRVRLERRLRPGLVMAEVEAMSAS